MTDRLPARRGVAPTRIVPTWVLWIALVAAMIGIVIWAGYVRWPTYSGFGGGTVKTTTTTTKNGNKTVEVTKQPQPARKVWDWLGLVGIGSALTLGGLIITRKQREREEAVAIERAQDEALAAYLDQMSNLVVDHELGYDQEDPAVSPVHYLITRLRTTRLWPGSGEDQKVQDESSDRKEQTRLLKVAQARTIAILLGLDSEHKRRPLKLVYELGLIKKDGTENGAMIELKNAGLDHAYLSELSLSAANLSCADLRVSDLSGDDLSHSDLRLADLRGADLRRANLENADLTGANFLPYDERDPERWNLHNLATIEDISKENFSPRKLRQGNRRFRITVRDGRLTTTELATTNLREAILMRAHLNDAYLCGADLREADLREADLSRADLRGADLRQVRNLTQEQIDVAIGDEKTKLTENESLRRPESWSTSVRSTEGTERTHSVNTRELQDRHS
jgi:uncharacterized protein YjbI with pentapeptide repeats